MNLPHRFECRREHDRGPRFTPTWVRGWSIPSRRRWHEDQAKRARRIARRLEQAKRLGAVIAGSFMNIAFRPTLAFHDLMFPEHVLHDPPYSLAPGDSLDLEWKADVETCGSITLLSMDAPPVKPT